jgi:MFS transporter, DHA1 family, inner membrane transport protein
MFSRTERIILSFLAFIQFNHVVDFMVMMPLGPQIMRELAMGPSQFGFVISSYTLSAGIMGFLAAFFIDRFDRKRALMFLGFGFSIGTFLCALAPNFLLLALARSTAGAFGGVMGSVVLSVIGDAVSFERRGKAMGIVMAAFSLASVLGVPFSLYLSTQWGWHAPFVFLGIISFSLTVALSFLFPSMRGHLHVRKVSPLESVASLVSEKDILKRLAFLSLLIFGQFTVIPFLSPSLVANVGLPEASLMYVYLVGGFFTIFTGPLIGRFCDRLGLRRMAVSGILFSLIPIYIITNMGRTNLTFMYVIVSTFFVAMGGRMIPVMTMMTSSVPPERRGTFMSLVTCIQQLSAALAASVAGHIITKQADGTLAHYSSIGWISIGCSIAGLLLLPATVAVTFHPKTEVSPG